MVENYNLSQRLLAYLLALSLFLQSCGNVPNQIKPLKDESKPGMPGSSNQVDIQQLLEQDFTAEKNYIVTFYEDNRILKADVKVDAPQSPIYKGLPVTIEEGTEIAELHHLDLQTQQQRIQLRQPKNGQPGRVLILKGGLLGGMLEGDNYQEKEREKEAEKEKLKEGELEDLLAYAQSGNREAQFALGERCYEAWQQHYKEEDLQEAKKWLAKAAAQGHQVAIALLAEVNLPPLVEDSKAIKHTGKGKEKEFNPDTSPILTTKATFNKQNQTYLPPIPNPVLQEDSQQQELKNRIIDQLAQPAYYQHIKLELHKHLLSPTLSQKQNETLSELIKIITAPEKKLRLGGDRELREDFRAKPSQEHNLFEPLRRDIQKLIGYKQVFSDTPIEPLLEELIEKHQAFIANLTEQVKNLGPTAPLKLFETKPLVQGEGFDCYEVRTKKAYQLACYNLHEYEYIRGNTSGLSIGSIQGGVYFKVDNGTGLLRPAKEHAVYSFYQALGLTDLLSPTHLVIMNRLSILPPDIGESPERRELSQKKQELETPSTQEVFNHYPELEQKLKVAQKERSLFIQGSLVVPGKTLEKFLEEAEVTRNPDSIIQQLEPASFSGHVLASLLLLPTDYKPDNLMVDEHNRVIGIDNDAALEAAELRRLNSSNKHGISIKNILYLLPLMQSGIAATIQRQFIEVHPALFLLNWLIGLQDKQLHYDYLLNTSLVDVQNTAQIKKNAEQSLGLPLQFVPGWIAGMYKRFTKIQTILKNNSSTTHQELFEQIYPFASRYYKAVKKLFTHPLDEIAFIYEKTPKDFATPISNDFEDLIAQYPELEDEALLNNLAQSSFIKQDPSLSIRQATQELIAIIDLKNYDASQQLTYIERVVAVGICPDKLHNSWYDPLLLIHMIAEGASNKVIKAIIDKGNVDIHTRDEAGETVLHAALRRGGQDALRQISLLIKLGADREAQADQTAVTPLDLTAEKEDIDLFKLLIDLGAGEKAIYTKINNFYKKLSVEEKEALIPHITKLAQINPKAAWKISLDEIFPIQGENSKGKGVLRTVTEGDRIISEKAWNKLFEKDGKPKKENAYGVRSVPFVEKNDQRIYLKFFPQLPGTELAVIRLADNLLGYCAPYCELASINGIPVLLTQGVPGETLYEVLKHHPEKLNQLDPESVSKALILAILINPGDGNLGNYILSPFTNTEGKECYRLISIDNDQAFMPAVAKTIKTGLWGSTLSLQVKTILYCLEAIKQPIGEAIIDKIKNTDLLKMLENWLSSLKIHHEAARNHFDSTLLRKYQQDKTTVIGVAFAPGMIKQLFSKLMRLQTTLNTKKAPRHFELLEALEPFVAHRYRTVIMDGRLNTIEKFKRAENITEEQALTSSSNALPQLLISREIREIDKLQTSLWVGNYGPSQALQELEEVKQEHTNISQILKDLGQLDVKKLRQSTTGITERLLREADLTRLSLTQQKALLDAIKGQELRYVHLRICNALKGALLTSFNLDHIKKLDLSGCSNLGSISSGLLGGSPLIMPILTHFRLDESGVSSIRLRAPQLKKLNVRNCPKVKDIELIAPKLHRLDLRGATGLSEKTIRSLFEQFRNAFIYLTPTSAFPQQICAHYLNEQGLAYLANNEYNLAAHYLKQSADQGNTTAHSPLTKVALQGNNIAQRWVIEQTEKGEKKVRETLYKLGSMYEQGAGVQKDENKAAEWYIKAVKQVYWGSFSALSRLALKGFALAQKWIREEAQNGNRQAQYVFAKMYENGIGVKENENKAAKWYIKAANRADYSSFSALSRLALKGSALAQKWIREEDKGNMQVQYTLAEMYENGIGIEKNESKAAEWYIKAAKQGHNQAYFNLIILRLKSTTHDQESGREGLKKGDEITKGILELIRNQIENLGVNKFAKVLPKTDIHTLNLRKNQIGTSGANKLAEVLPKTDIRTLNLRKNQIGTSGATMLAAALPNTQIHTLDLSWNQIGDKGVIKLAEVLPNTQIHTLNLACNEIEDLKMTKLAQTLPNSQIHTLNLKYNQIGAEGVRKLTKALPKSKIHTLNIGDNQISASGASKLAEALPNTKIHVLDLSTNQIGDEGAMNLAEALPNSQIHTLNLSRNKIEYEGAMNLTKILSKSSIHMLDLSRNPIRAKGAKKLAKALSKSKLHMLNLSYTQIGDKGAMKLAEVLPNTQISTLDLRNNQIGVLGTTYLAGVLPSSQINNLDLWGNSIGDEGAMRLAKTLHNLHNLFTLNLGNNQIGDKGTMELAKKLSKSKLHTLNLEYNQIDDEIKELLCQQNPKINFIF